MTRFWVYVHNGLKGSQKMVARKSKYDGKQNWCLQPLFTKGWQI